MTTNHIDQLAQWWDEAEEGVIEKGDTVINRSESETTVYVATVRAHRQHPNARILARAPKPKPAWHDAVAVMARCSGAPEGHREPFIRSEATPDVWIGEGGCGYTDVLRDVTPLIEAKVTDAMIDRILDVIDARFDNYPAGIGEELAVAALGLETA